MAKRSLEIVIAAKDRTQRAFTAAGAGMQGLGRRMLSLRNIAIAGIGIYAIRREITQGLAAFGVQEQAVNNLGAALEQLGARAQLPEMEKLAKDIQEVTVIGDEAVLMGMKLLASLGRLEGEGLKKATYAAIGLSRRIGKDLNTAMLLVARAAVGDTAQLTRYGVKLDQTLSPQERFNKLLEMGAESFALATAEAETGTGRLGQFKNMVSDLREKVGEALMPAVIALTGFFKEQRGAVEELIGKFGGAVQGVVSFVAANREMVIGLGKTALALTAVLIIGPPLIVVIKGIAAAAMFLAANPLVLLATAIGACIAVMVPWEDIMKLVVRTAPNVSEAISGIGESARETTEALARMNTELASQTPTARYERQLDAYIEQLDALEDAEYDIRKADLRLLAVREEMEKKREKAQRKAAAGETRDPTLLRFNELYRQELEIEKEIARMQAMLDAPRPTKPVKPGRAGDIFQSMTAGLAGLPGKAGALGEMIPEWMRPEYQEKNAEALKALSRVRAQGIADDLKRETELIKLAYAERIEAAQKAGQDIRLVERARDMEIAQARQTAESREAEGRLARAKDLSQEIARLRITTTKEGLAEEMALLKLAEREELAVARDKAERMQVQEKYMLLRKQAEQEAEPTPRGPVSIPFVERGFMTRAPGHYDPYKEAEKHQKQIAVNTSLAAKAGQAALSILGNIAEKLGLKPPVADF